MVKLAPKAGLPWCRLVFPGALVSSPSPAWPVLSQEGGGRRVALSFPVSPADGRRLFTEVALSMSSESDCLALPRGTLVMSTVLPL